MRAYTFVLLLHGPRADEFGPEELSALQSAHLGHLARMREAGVLVAAGPFSEQRDETLRGFCLYDCPLEEARRLAHSDPSVQAGRMAVDVMTWSTSSPVAALTPGLTSPGPSV